MGFDLEQARVLTQEALAVARHAGKRIVEVYAGDCDVRYKSDNTAAHRIIVDELRELHPDLPVLSEESTQVSFEERHEWDAYWLVDPLDGTREFLRRRVSPSER